MEEHLRTAASIAVIAWNVFFVLFLPFSYYLWLSFNFLQQNSVYYGRATIRRELVVFENRWCCCCLLWTSKWGLTADLERVFVRWVNVCHFRDLFNNIFQRYSQLRVAVRDGYKNLELWRSHLKVVEGIMNFSFCFFYYGNCLFDKQQKIEISKGLASVHSWLICSSSPARIVILFVNNTTFQLISLMHNIPKWSIFKVCLIILGNYALKG